MSDTSSPSGSGRATDALGALELIRHGTLAIEGRLLSASNATFYCGVEHEGVSAAAVYKPIRGERPLWDFPNGTLAGREVAMYLLSEATGWDIVPPTVLRDGPLGPGMCQLWIEPDTDVAVVDVVQRGVVPEGWLHVFDAYDGEGDEVSLVHVDSPALRRVAVLDVVANNADRKGGHLLVSQEGEVFGVDHGLCFHVENKLRTVLWGWAGAGLSETELEVLERLEQRLTTDEALRGALGAHIDADEIDALRDRVVKLRATARFPEPGEGWPAIPWPVF